MKVNDRSVRLTCIAKSMDRKALSVGELTKKNVIVVAQKKRVFLEPCFGIKL